MKDNKPNFKIIIITILSVLVCLMAWLLSFETYYMSSVYILHDVIIVLISAFFVVLIINSFVCHKSKSRYIRIALCFLLILNIPLLLMWNTAKITKLNNDYLESDSQFNTDARSFMPKETSFENAKTVDLYHMIAPSNEWVQATAWYDSAEYYSEIDSIEQKYRFYETGSLDNNKLFCTTPNPFELNGFVYRIVDLDFIDTELSNQYVGLIGINDLENCIRYIFLASSDFNIMGVDGVLRCIGIDGYLH